MLFEKRTAKISGYLFPTNFFMPFYSHPLHTQAVLKNYPLFFPKRAAKISSGNLLPNLFSILNQLYYPTNLSNHPKIKFKKSYQSLTWQPFTDLITIPIKADLPRRHEDSKYRFLHVFVCLWQKILHQNLLIPGPSSAQSSSEN